MAIIIQLNVVRGHGAEGILTAATAVSTAFNTADIVDAQSLDGFTAQPSGARATFRYFDPTSGRGADQIDVTNPLSYIVAASNAPLA